MVLKDPLDDLLHFSKNGEDLLVNFMDSAIRNCDKWCPFTHNPERRTEFSCYFMNPSVKRVIRFLEIYAQLFRYFEIYDSKEESLDSLINDIKRPESNPSLTAFKKKFKPSKRHH